MKIKDKDGEVLGEIALTNNERMLLENLCASEDGAIAMARMLARFYREGHAAGVASVSSAPSDDGDDDLIDEDPEDGDDEYGPGLDWVPCSCTRVTVEVPADPKCNFCSGSGVESERERCSCTFRDEDGAKDPDPNCQQCDGEGRRVWGL